MDDTRGEITNRKRAQQLVDFSGLKIDTITPTDVDGFIEYHQSLFIFFELKLNGKDLPRGQIVAFTTLVDSLNKPAIFIIADHDVPAVQDIDAATTIVRNYYFKGKWHRPRKAMTLREAVLQFVIFVENKPL